MKMVRDEILDGFGKEKRVLEKMINDEFTKHLDFREQLGAWRYLWVWVLNDITKRIVKTQGNEIDETNKYT